jgi:3-hydroxybutyryl-CoA dehydratase
MPAPAQSSTQSVTRYFEDMAVGQTARLTRTVTAADIVAFADVTGDHNPLHLDAEFAAKSVFKERIAHGMLSASLIAAVFGESLPGPGAIYLSQTFKFRAPVKIGDAVTAQVEITGTVPEKRLVMFKTQCLVGDKVVIDGEATLIVPARPSVP